MIGVDHFMTIKELHQEGHAIKAIARITGHSRNTVRKVLRGEHRLVAKPRASTSKLDPFKPYVEDRYHACQLSAVRMLEEIQPMGYQGSIATLRRFLRALKPQQRRASKLTVRFETPPGKQGQVDWMYCGRFPLPNGKVQPIYGFVLVLSYSRAMYIHFTTSMKLGELIACHQKAFDYLGGWPETLLYDNMKQVKRSRQQWNEQFIDFAQHYGIVPKTHRAFRPQTKGKVERAVHYVRDNFLAGRAFDSLEDLNAQARHWLDYTAHARIHGTTQIRPALLLHKEHPHLIPLGSVAHYQYTQAVNRTVNVEAMVHFKGSRYSVPPAYAGKTVQVTAPGGHIVVQCGDTVIAEHRAALKTGQCIVNKDHLAELWKLAVEQTHLPDKPQHYVHFDYQVQQRSLNQFDEVTR